MVLLGVFCLLTVLKLLVIASPILLRLWIRRRSKKLLPHLRKNNKGERTAVVGFFHPYCNAGGGGERVLWTAIRAIQNKYPRIQCVVYTGDIDASGPEILQRAVQRFNISVRPVEFIFLQRRSMVEASTYPYFTLLGQSLGSVVLGWEAMMKFVPDVYIDTMGYAFTMPLFKFLAGVSTMSYVHYPTISTDMLQKVADRRQAHNNASFISQSATLSWGKLQYYKMFAWLYGVMGRRSDKIFVNSTWTFNHIKQLWKAEDKTFIVYPPCDVSEFRKIPLTRSKASKTIISIAQFRPEKDHQLQVRSFYKFLNSQEDKDYKLLLVGSCRNEGDSARVRELQLLCNKLNLEENVEFKLNVSFEDLKKLMSASAIGIHTMWNEHFGIGVVELMAAGTIILAHNSGGPKLDIVTDFNNKKTGYLADSEESYAAAMNTIFKLSDDERYEIRQNARESVERFSEEEFEKGFLAVGEAIFEKVLQK